MKQVSQEKQQMAADLVDPMSKKEKKQREWWDGHLRFGSMCTFIAFPPKVQSNLLLAVTCRFSVSRMGENN